MKYIPYYLAALLFVFLAHPNVPKSHALNQPTHEFLNEQAAKSSSVEEVLKNQLGFSEGLRTTFRTPSETNSASRWIGLGGSREDDSSEWDIVTGRYRAFRHFHDPLKSWDRAGFSSPPWLRPFESSIRWAQRPNQSLEAVGGTFSYLNARNFFRTALMDPDPSKREQAYADMFRALGQVMHLIVDASVPEHVRNDPHVETNPYKIFGIMGNYEYWVLAEQRRAEDTFIQNYLSTPITLDPALLQIPIPTSEPIAQVPIARLFDSDRYSGLNPNVTVESSIGLAEIANANFLSLHTPFEPYVHPARANTEKYVGTYSKTREKRAYYRKAGVGDPRGVGLRVDPVAAECVLEDATGTVSPTFFICQDDDVWRATGRLMLPRAVRYAQEVLDYFFRGKFDVAREADPVSGLPSLRIVNRSREPLGEGGVFTLYQDDKNTGERRLIAGPSAPLSTAIPADNDDTPLRLQVPSGLEAETLMLVYKGPLGLEAGAVIGQVSRPVGVEELYYNWATTEWILRTKDGLYLLPLHATAGLGQPPAMVRWGDRDNQLVAVTAMPSGGPGGPGGDPGLPGGGPGPGGTDPYLALLFELERPLGSQEVPTTDTPSPSGLPVAKLRLVAQVPLYEVLGGINLNTTINFTENLALAQYTVSYVTRVVCQFNRDTWSYDCTTQSSGDSLRRAVDWSDTVQASFPLTLTPAHHVRNRMERHPEYFRWYLAEVRADQAGRLLALVEIQTTRLPEGAGARSVILADGGEMILEANFADPQLTVGLAVDLTGRRLLAKTSADQIEVEKLQRLVVPVDTGPLWTVERKHIESHGGPYDPDPIDAEYGYVANADPGALPVRIALVLTDAGERRVTRLEGLFRDSLAALGLGEMTHTPFTEQPGLRHYRYDPEGTTSYVLQTTERYSLRQGPAQLGGWWQFLGSAPGRLALQAISPQEEARTWLIDWNLETDVATVASVDTAPRPLFALTGNASGTLVGRVGEGFSFAEWRWIPRAGTPVVLGLPPQEPFMPAPLPHQMYDQVSFDYLALNPDYLYNRATGRFYALSPEVPEQAAPPLLVPKPGIDLPYFFLGDWNWAWEQGRYHVVGR